VLYARAQAPMPLYDPTATVRAAREHYFSTNGFAADGGYTQRWVKLSAGPLSFYIYNSQARVRAVRYHDIHHVLTEYATTWRGEAEIAAWELASGCGRHIAAWFLNLSAMAIGVLLWPADVWRAWRRGLQSGNLYSEAFDDALLDTHVGSLRRRLALDRELPPAGAGAVLSFAFAAPVALAVLMLSLAIVPLLLIALVRSLAS
jgi:hypothetical protein